MSKLDKYPIKGANSMKGQLELREPEPEPYGTRVMRITFVHCEEGGLFLPNTYSLLGWFKHWGIKDISCIVCWVKDSEADYVLFSLSYDRIIKRMGGQFPIRWWYDRNSQREFDSINYIRWITG